MRSTHEVAEVVRLCARHQHALGISLVPQGGNTGLVIGSIPDASGQQIVLSLKRMNQVLAIDPANLTMTLQPPSVLRSVSQSLRPGLLGHRVLSSARLRPTATTRSV